MLFSAKFRLLLARILLGPAVAALCVVGASAQSPQDEAAPVSLAKLASEFEKSPDTVVATVNDTPVTLGTVADRLRDFAPNLAVLPSSMVYKAALEDVIQQRAMAVKAKELGYDQDPATVRRIQAATDHELALALVRKLLPEMVTDKAIQDRYNLTYANKPGPEEVRFRVIAVATETDANLVIAALNKGANFAEVAKTSSRDPSSINGGEIAFTPRDRLKPEISSVVFALLPGQWSLFPIYTNGLWWIVQVEERRQGGTPSLDATREQVRAELTREASAEIVLKTRAAVAVKDLGPTGKKDAAPR